ncbi:MAG: PLP-dependent aminotransferase family protein, partial [Lysobacteraceae bacterium]
SQQAFDLLLRVFIEPGDVVIVESPAYTAALQALRLAGAEILEVPVDAEGLRTDALEELLQQPRARRAKLLYTVPNFSNPSGTLLSAGRREALVRLALMHDFLIIEDDPYGELRFVDEVPAPLAAYGSRLGGERNPVIYLSSLSKTVAPALRIGWLIGPPEIVRRCTVAKQTGDLCTSPLNQVIAAEYLRAGRYPATVAAARAEYGRRVDALANGLATELEDRVSFTRPQGGMFLWAERTMPVDPQRLFQACVEAGVLFVPGAVFYPGQPRQQTMRLSFAAPDVGQIEEGVQRLGEAFRRAAE